MRNIQKLTAINEKAVAIGSKIKLLGNISWPTHSEQQFLKCYKLGKKWTPDFVYQKVDYSLQRQELKKLSSSFTAQNPLESYTKKTIKSYISAIDLNHSVGTKSFTELSKKIFGVPDDILPGSNKNVIHAAEKLVKIAMEFSSPFPTDFKTKVHAEDIKSYIDRRVEGVFKGEGPSVVITEGLTAKATATPKLIRLQAGGEFTPYDFKQLFYHEVMTHALTALNGEKQPILKCLSRGSLRTLKTQEGLATFSEIITGAMDIHRLKRLALRVLAIDRALKGANFQETFEFFLSKDQSEKESFAATHRIFRGGFPDKHIIFTKDCIYLEGLLSIHTLFRWAMKHNRLDICHLLFSGRLSIEDAFELEEAYNYQWITHPHFLPGWFSNIEGLAGILSFSLLANLVRIDVTKKEFFLAA